MKEIFKDIPGYEGLYQVSNLGNVKSLNYNREKREKILKNVVNNNGYLVFTLSKNKIRKNINGHQLVAMAFLNYIPNGKMDFVVDHKNDIKIDNRVENLQVITQRENAYKTQGKHTSRYKGVSLNKALNKWVAQITINKKIKHLGFFMKECDAHLAYQKALSEL